ncbi:MAG: Fic family protein [Sphaerochaetaceae bacterium]|nr:Fic family protein [Sphaerochaetaceae bacterium]
MNLSYARQSNKQIFHVTGKDETVFDVNENELAWINGANELRPLVKSAIVSLWFVVIHPFDDGNGRISRALADHVLARGEHQQFRYLSLSKKILDERAEYYARLQGVGGQRDSADITEWLLWYVRMATRALGRTLESFSAAIRRRRLIQFLDPSEFNARQISMLMNLSGGDFRGKLTKGKWMIMTKSTAATAIRDINALVEKHLLVRSEQGGRSTSYVLDIAALDQQCL